MTTRFPTAYAVFQLSLLVSLAAGASAQTLPCAPCGGISTTDPAAVATALAATAPLPEEGLLVVAWPADLAATADPGTGPAGRLAAAGATPLLSLRFTTPAPLTGHLDELGRELGAAAAVVRRSPPGSWFQITWEPRVPPAPDSRAADTAFFVKRAAVAVTGAGGARVVSGPLPADPAFLRDLYAQEVAAYLDLVALEPAPAEPLAAALETLATLDPGKPVVLDAVPLPGAAETLLTEAARYAAAGVSLVLFEPAAEVGATEVGAAELVPPLAALAREFAGDVSFDPYSTPRAAGGSEAWSFVRGEDLALRVIARPSEAARAAGELTLTFSDPQLRDPQRVPVAGGAPIPLAGVRRSRDGLELSVADPGAATLLRLARPSMEELVGEGGVAEELTVASERQIPVEEILRRLQAFEDAQSRRIEHWQAVNRTHLRFQLGTGTQTFEATLEGPFFFRRDGLADWAWETFYVNGVRWRGGKIPEIPLVEPEKAATLPLEITFDKTYRYRLAGTDTIDGRDAWVVAFEPADETRAAAENLYRGTVWIDRELYVRLRTRGVQVGLEGEVLSNEETLFYRPVSAAGEPLPWGGDAFVMPLRTVSHQLLSVLNATTLVERETTFEEVRINAESFDDDLARVAASDVTMVRDTDQGLRYLVPDEETGERVVQEDFDRDRTFLAGGTFYDESLDFPLPLAGINYFSFDFRDTGTQLNALFAGALLTVSAADPDFLGSRWDAGFDVFALAVAGSDQVFRDGREIEGEEIEVRPASLDLKLGRPIGPYVKLRAQYELDYRSYGTSDDTDPGFILPQDHFTHQMSLFGRVSRAGYQLDLGGTYNRRSDWQAWGLPGTPGFVADPEPFEDYLTWEASLSKSWYLPSFRKVGLELNYLDGQDLDRFSKYGFGFFGDTRVHGYQSDKVKAERAYLAHATYGFELSELLRIDGIVDLAWATDEAAGLDNELLAGVGLAGSFVGPWQTLVNVDLGVAVEGPDDGFTAWVVFLKLLDWQWLEGWLE